MSENTDVVLRLSDITKTFPGVKALNHVNLELKKGKILGLVGENGAGKSTLMKILTGAYTKDAGSIELDSQIVEIDSTSKGRQLGISIIYQELSLLPQLTVAENMFLGNWKMRPGGTVDWAGMEREARAALSEMGLSIPVKRLVRDLNVAECQMVEICRAAIINNAKVLIMDEPTSSLVDREVRNMFAIMRDLKKKGISIIYITHRLEELFEITDRIEVLKDGENSRSFLTSQVTRDDIVTAMVGRELNDYYPPHGKGRGKPVLEVRNLSQGNRVKDISFTAYAGEILGFAGLIGAGRSETMLSVFGALPDVSGEIYLNGEPVSCKKPHDAIAAGIALAPENRKEQGLVQIFPITQNITLANLRGIFGKLRTLNLKKERDTANSYVKSLNIRTPDASKRVQELSGGNQQKVIVGKWLFTNAKVIIFDEPTKGIDVGAKAEIYRTMRRLADEGVAVIMVSSELPEVIGVSDRILVMHEGRLKGEFYSGNVDEERIMQAAIGGAQS